MLIAGFPAGSFAANCYLVAAGPAEECLIIDPGQDAERGIEEIVAQYRLRPAAVLLTHGHIDHIWSVAPVCGARNIPAYIHPDDRALLSDPARGFSMLAGQQLFGGRPGPAGQAPPRPTSPRRPGRCSAPRRGASRCWPASSFSAGSPSPSPTR